ncbi:uncharacterized protein LOC126838155 [Adelges cooleyi]|uniref:uncharacterized protein LOC126838155 n=1 Tax=Adelges cooleyi TaxID=133065 RepID=UPI002180110B|nr:uncharacterized protein LOC126838155 [Adelges cooleyi]
MFSYTDVIESDVFKSITLINTVTCVKFVGCYLFAGVGNCLLVYDTRTKSLSLRKKIFDKASIHGIQNNNDTTLIAIHGENYVAIHKLTTHNGFLLTFECILQTDDWVCNILWLKDNLLLSVSSHNIAKVWNFNLNKELNSSKCDEQCILYSATSVGEDIDNTIIFSGTVFREIVIWSPFRRHNCTNILHRLQKHEGVIFSIYVNKSNTLLSSTSDDRSIVIWNVETSIKYKTLYEHWKNATIAPKYSFYAHKARVWKSILLTSGSVLSAGEDGQICLNSLSSIYQWEESRGSQVRSLDYLENEYLMASGCTTGSVGLWSLDSIPKCSVLDDYKILNRYPKHLVILNNICTLVLYSDGQVVEYKTTISRDVYQNDILCCTLTMTKSPCERLILFTTSSGHIVILNNIGEKHVQFFYDQISSTKINCSLWLNSKNVITSSVGNTICSYKINEDLKLHHIGTYNISSKANIWITAAVQIESLILTGSNEGSIFVFLQNQKEPIQVFNKVHSFAGVTAMWFHGQFLNTLIVSSVGRDGCHRYWSISAETNHIFETRCEILPTKWPFRIYNTRTNGLLICGFKENNLIIYSSVEQRILASVFCGGGHRAWDLTFANNSTDIYFVCSSASGKLEMKKIPLNGQHTLLKGFHSMIINSMSQIDNNLMVTGSDDTTVRLTRFGQELNNILTLRSHISSVRSVSSLQLEPDVYVIVTAGGRAQLKVWILKTADNDVYCEESVSYLLKTKHEKKPWKSKPSNEGETRFMDVCLQLTKSKSVLISVGCSDAILRLYNFNVDSKILCPIIESADCNNCILKVLKAQIHMTHYILSMDTRGYVLFWDISVCINNNSESLSNILPVYKNSFHQSGINCCDWLKLENEYNLLTTGGDDQCICLTIFRLENDTVVLGCTSSITVHNSQVTGVRIFDTFVLSTSVDQKIIFSSWQFNATTNKIIISSLATYFTTVADIHGFIAQKEGNVVRTIVYGQGVEMFCADMDQLTDEPTVERCTEPLELGEGPHWQQSTQSLYFVDLHKGSIHRYHPETKSHYKAVIEGYQDVTLVIPVDEKPNTFVVGLGPSIGVVEWDGVANKTSAPSYLKLVDTKPGNRLNDGKADATGRLWVGSMGPEMEDLPGHYHKSRGTLFSVELDGSIVVRVPNVSISNGLAWSSNNKEFFYIDTYKWAVVGFDFDITSGELANPRVIFDLKTKNVSGDPDGMTIDSDGNLWVACFNSNHILKINPSTGKLLQSVKLPAYQITSAAFGGPNMDELYVTTAGYQLTDEQYTRRPDSGSLFRILKTGSTGFPGVSAKIHQCPENHLHTV